MSDSQVPAPTSASAPAAGSCSGDGQTSSAASTAPQAWASAWWSPRSHVTLWATAALGLSIDLLTKHLAFSRLPSKDPIVLIPRFLSLDRSLNFGALFGIGKGMSPLFILASILAVAFVAYMFASSHRRQWLVHLALGLVLAGALGNLYDRLFVKIDVISRGGQVVRYGTISRDQPQDDAIQVGRYPDGGEPRWRFGRNVEVTTRTAVRDFIRIDTLFRKQPLWPWIFNIADSMLVVGVSLLLIIYSAPPRRPTRRPFVAIAPHSLFNLSENPVPTPQPPLLLQ